MALIRPFGGGSSGGSSGGPSSYLGQIGTRCFPPNSDSGASITYGMSQSAHYLRDKVTTQLVAEFPNFRLSTAVETDRGATAGTIKASIRLPNGTWLLSDQNIAAGNAAVAFPAGTTPLTWTMPAGVTLPNGYLLLVRVYQYNAAGIYWSAVAGGNVYGNHPLDFMDIGGGTGTDKTTNGATIGAANGICYFPAVLAAATTNPAVMNLGTSRETGGVGVMGDYLSDLGLTARTLGKRMGYSNFAQSGTLLSQWNAGSHAYLNALLAKGYFTHLTVEYGINDIPSDAAASTTAARRALLAANIKAAAPNIIIIGHTIYHWPSSSDNFVSKVNQSISTNDQRVLNFNVLVRAGITGEDMVWDVAAGLDPLLTGTAPATADVNAQSYTPSIFTGALSGTTLTVSAFTSGPPLSPGDTIMDPTSTDTSVVIYNTVILKQLTGTPGGIGTYQVNNIHDGSFPRNAAVTSRTLSTAGRITRDGLHLSFFGEDIVVQRKGPDLVGMVRR